METIKAVLDVTRTQVDALNREAIEASERKPGTAMRVNQKTGVQTDRFPFRQFDLDNVLNKLQVFGPLLAVVEKDENEAIKEQVFALRGRIASIWSATQKARDEIRATRS